VPKLVAGVDEAGAARSRPGGVRGGHPESALPPAGLDDSKALCEAGARAPVPWCSASCLCWQVVFVEREEIDALNILWATMAGMRRAVCAMAAAPTRVLVDGDACRRTALPARCAGRRRRRSRRSWPLHPRESQPRPPHAHARRAPSGLRIRAPQGLFDAGTPRGARAPGPCVEHRRSFAPVRERMQIALFDETTEAV
jgi:ribonuclease HII